MARSLNNMVHIRDPILIAIYAIDVKIECFRYILGWLVTNHETKPICITI